jgi:hypothetical protein
LDNDYTVDFKDASLEYSDFESAYLMKTNFQQAILHDTNFQKAFLQEANFTHAKLDFSNFQNAKLFKAEMQWAYLISTNLTSANLSGTNLKYTSFSHAHIEQCNLTAVRNLNNTKFDGTFVDGAIFNDIDVEIYRLKHYLKYIPHLIAFKLREYFERYYVKTEEKSTNVAISPLYRKLGFEKGEQIYPPPKHKPAVLDLSKVNGLDNIVCSDSIFKRELIDMQFIQQFEKRHPFIAFFWWISSECGRNLTLWVVWSILIALIFGFVYAKHPSDFGLSGMEGTTTIRNVIDKNSEICRFTETSTDINGNQTHFRKPSGFTPYYFSIVTFTTLGFGDVIPLSKKAEIWLACEVILGYIMLGGLISILANKLARRS